MTLDWGKMYLNDSLVRNEVGGNVNTETNRHNTHRLPRAAEPSIEGEIQNIPRNLNSYQAGRPTKRAKLEPQLPRVVKTKLGFQLQ